MKVYEMRLSVIATQIIKGNFPAIDSTNVIKGYHDIPGFVLGAGVDGKHSPKTLTFRRGCNRARRREGRARSNAYEGE